MGLRVIPLPFTGLRDLGGIESHHEFLCREHDGVDDFADPVVAYFAWLVGEKTIEGALENYDKHKALYVEFSPYNHLDKDDPPLFMSYGNNMKLPSENAGHGIHHPVYGVKMKEKADRVGQECHLLIKDVSKSKEYANANEFLMGKLLAPKSSTQARKD